MADEPLELAYDAATKALVQQDTTLGNLRNRANALLSVAALAASFSAGIGVYTTDAGKGRILPAWALWGLFGTLVLVGYCVMRIAWPVSSWSFGPDSDDVLQQAQQNASIDDIRRNLAAEMTKARGRNSAEIKSRVRHYRVAVGLLVIEVSVFVVALALPHNPPQAQLTEPIVIRLKD